MGRRVFYVALMLLTMVLFTNCDPSIQEMVATPEIIMKSDNSGQYIEITCEKLGASIYYAIGPTHYSTTTPSTNYFRKIQAENIIPSYSDNSRYVLAIAKSPGMMDSIVVSREVTKADEPQITYYSYTNTVRISTYSLNSGLVYTTDGTTPSRRNGTKTTASYVEFQKPSGSYTTIKAIVLGDDDFRIMDSQVATENIY